MIKNIPQKEEIEQFKKLNSDFFEMIEKQGYQYDNDTTLTDLEIMEYDNKDKMSKKYFLKKDEKGIYIIMNNILLKNSGLFSCPRLKTRSMHIEGRSGENKMFGDIIFNNVEIETLFLFLISCTSLKINKSKIKDINMHACGFEKYNINDFECINFKINKQTYIAKNLKITNSIVEYIKTENCCIDKFELTNIINKHFTCDNNSVVESLELNNSTFKNVKLSGYLDKCYVKIVTGEFIGVEDLNITNNTIMNSKIEYPTLNKLSIAKNACIKEVNCPNLQEIEIIDCKNFQIINNGDNIVDMYFENTGLEQINNCKRVKKIKVKNNNKNINKSLKRIENCPNVEDIDVEGDINDFKNMNKLKKLKLYNNYFDKNNLEQKRNLSITNCNNLYFIKFNNVKLLTPIQNEIFPKLKKIILDNCDATLKDNISKLTSLILYQTKLTEKVNVNNYPLIKQFKVRETDNTIEIFDGIYNTNFIDSYGNKKNIHSSNLYVGDMEKLIQENEGTQLMLKLLKKDKNLKNADFSEINKRDNKDLGAAVYCKTVEQLKILYENGYQFREIEIDLIKKKISTLYENYYLRNKVLVEFEESYNSIPENIRNKFQLPK